MSERPTRFLRLALAACALASARPAAGHEFKLESVMTAFVRIDAREAHLVLRLPLHLAGTVRFPLAGQVLDVSRAQPSIAEALAALSRDVTLWEGERVLTPSRMEGQLALPSDRSFDRVEDAIAAIERPLPAGTAIYPGQGFLDLHVTYPITSPRSRFSIRTEVAPELKGYLKLAIRYLPLDEPARPMVITSRSGRVSLNPEWYRVVASFALLGVEHILTGIDHLLFLLCLVVPLARLGSVFRVVTAFTLAHSLTLAGSAFGLAPSGPWFPPFVETGIAVSILYMALENVLGGGPSRRWLVTGLFGLVHGFGFSYGLREDLQFAGRHLVVSLFSFNLGIELGQVAVLGVLLPALALLRRGALGQRAGVIVLSALVGHTAWHWTLERGEVLWKAAWPSLDGRSAMTLARWGALFLVLYGLVRLGGRRAAAVLARAPRRGDRGQVPQAREVSARPPAPETSGSGSTVPRASQARGLLSP